MSMGDTVAQSGLAHVSLVAAPGASGSVVLTAQPVLGLLMLRAVSDAPALSKALKERCGVSLSARLQSETHSETHSDYCVRWMAPDCWLLSCPLDEAFSIEQAVRAGVDGHIAIVNVSGRVLHCGIVGK